MGQIVKKKKGRPSKADLAARAAAAAESNDRHHSQRRRETAEEEQDDGRRSHRRRSCVRYNLIDYDEDYLEDDEDFEVHDNDDEGLAAEEWGERREKKLKFVLKLPNGSNGGRTIRSNGGGDSVDRGQRRRSELEGEEEEDGEEEEENPVSKRRKISGDGDEKEDYGDNDDEEEAGGKGESNQGDFVHGTLNDVPSRTPMPGKKQLELMLDKLQKKDTYGVYAEPVDPKELPDYHDIIKHPMDFATVRKKLSNGSYSVFEQFESDVYLICSNAMQYNAPDTIYHKQARTIKELAQKKFERVRAGIERTMIENGRTEKEAMSEQKTKLNPITKKQMKKPIGCSTHDLVVSSGFPSRAALATTDAHNTRNCVLASNCERPTNNEGLVEGISSLAEGNAEKVEDLQSGKGMAPKLGKKPLVVDENRRGTYEISNQPVHRSDSIFSTFEGEDKQLIPVGLYGEHSYAQSLARFAATLGHIAWRIASKRIERALPPGSKFGPGWVVEYEPLPTPVLFVASQPHKEYSSAPKPQSPSVPVKIDEPNETKVTSTEQLDVGGPTSNGRPCFLLRSGGSRSATPSGTVAQQKNPFARKPQNAAHPVKGDDLGAITPTDAVTQPQNPFSRSENMVRNRVEANGPNLANQDTNFFVQKQFPVSGEMASSWQVDMIARNKNFLQPVPFGLTPPANQGTFTGELPNGNRNGYVDINQMAILSSGGASTKAIGTKTSFPPRQEQGLSDPVRVMRLIAENAYQKQQILQPGAHPVQGTMHFRPGRSNSPFQERVVQNRQMVFPHLPADLSRVPLQPPSQGLSTQPKQKQDTLPPDLNIAFQSTVDPQQPDLALQL